MMSKSSIESSTATSNNDIGADDEKTDKVGEDQKNPTIPESSCDSKSANPNSVSIIKEPSFTIINTLEQLQEITHQLLKEESTLALDCEGVNLSRHGKLCILQLATRNHGYIIDILELRQQHGESLFEKGGLKEVLESSTVLKIIHDCRRDSDALFHQFGVKLKNVFDTQVADIWIRRNYALKMPRYVRGYSVLLSFYLGIDKDSLPDKNAGSLQIKQDEFLWERRPLDDALLRYAWTDVAYLHDLMDAMQERMLTGFRLGVDRYLDHDRAKQSVPIGHIRKDPKEFEFLLGNNSHTNHHHRNMLINAGKKNERGAECDYYLFHEHKKS